MIIFSKTTEEIAGCLKRATSILYHMLSLYSGVRQPSFHRAPPSYLSEDQERLQKRAMKII